MVTVTVQGQLQKVVPGLLDQARHISGLLATLDDDELRRPVPHPQADSVHALLAWLVVCASEVLSALSTSTSARPVDVGDLILGGRVRQHAKGDLAAELAAHQDGRTLAIHLGQQMDEIQVRVGEPTVPAVVSTDGRAARTLDLLRATAVDLVLAADDLAASLPGREMRWSRECVATATRALAEALAGRHPGRSIEVRVPPYAAVQCGTGDDPTHTRGTPPNVVEIEPMTFVRLAHGRTRFADELRQGRVTASGTRSDLSAWFPLHG